MNDCYYDKKDWRACKTEVGVEPQPELFFHSVLILGEEKSELTFFPQMEAFRQCWKRQGNEERTQSKETSSKE